MANLILHCGANAVTREQLAATHTPPATLTWQPIPHLELVQTIEGALGRHNLGVATEAHALTHDGYRYFGLIELRQKVAGAEYTWVMGIRNSHDLTLPAGLVVGSQVFVCDNLAFSGEICVSRKHTRFIRRDLPELVETAVVQMIGKFHDQDVRIARYRQVDLSDPQAHDLTIRAFDAGVIPVTRVPDVLGQWRTPQHEAFQPRTLWSWFNGVTETLKGALHLLPARTQALYEVCDRFARID